MARNKLPTLGDIGLQPKLGDDLSYLFKWLDNNKLTLQAETYDRNSPPAYGEIFNADDLSVIAAPASRVKKLTQDEKNRLKEEYLKDTEGLSGINPESVWRTIRDLEAKIRSLEFQRLPADALAFYRPFHYPPFSQWGIYIMIEPLLEYHYNLSKILCNLGIYSPSTLMHCVLFEIFHHEFFHHLVESTATTIEIISAGFDKVRPIFLEYKDQQINGDLNYLHAPLEEALANAYAHNSLSFISRVKAGYRPSIIRFYQKAIKKYWKTEPAGYRDAGYYINGGHVAGGAHLISLMFKTLGLGDLVPLMTLSKSVMPSGFSAYIAKPDIPTYLVGNPMQIAEFYKLVPAPNEAYTQLFWPYDTANIDKYIQEQKKKLKEQRGLH